MKEKCNFKIGDSVKVKKHVIDPDDGVTQVGGWCGRVYNINLKDGLVDIEWDSITLGNMDFKAIDRYDSEGLSWNKMSLDCDEVEKCNPQDTENDVKNKLDEIYTILENTNTN